MVNTSHSAEKKSELQDGKKQQQQKKTKNKNVWFVR